MCHHSIMPSLYFLLFLLYFPCILHLICRIFLNAFHLLHTKQLISLEEPKTPNNMKQIVMSISKWIWFWRNLIDSVNSISFTSSIISWMNVCCFRVLAYYLNSIITKSWFFPSFLWEWGNGDICLCHDVDFTLSVFGFF